MLLRFACAALLVAGAATAAETGSALHPHEKLNHWGRWGADDERGAANFITPGAIVAAAKLVQSGKVFSLAIPLDGEGPVYPTRINPHHTMVVTGADYHAAPDLAPGGMRGPVRFADDYIYMPLQGSTQWDGLSHAWYGGKLYNGVPETAIRSSGAGGATKLGIQNIKDGMVGRGVLVDVVRYKGGALPDAYQITLADVEGALAQQGTRVEPGDMVLVRTGVVPAFYRLATPTERTAFLIRPQAGLGEDLVPWIKEKRIAGIAADNIALEVLPNPNDPESVAPLHANLLRDLGVYIGEIWWLEELAEDCARDGRHEFFLAAQPLNVTGGVGSPLNPIAIK
jgi:kynurenine formamidase